MEGPVASGTTIGDADGARAILLTSGTITLPHAASGAGKLILIQNASAYNGSNSIVIGVQGTDHIINHNSFNTSQGKATSCTVWTSAEFVSDGTSLWYLTRVVGGTVGAAVSCDSSGATNQ
jgi:hypothetical protein